MSYLAVVDEEQEMATEKKRWDSDQLTQFVAKERAKGTPFNDILGMLEHQKVVSLRTGKPYSEHTLRSYMSESRQVRQNKRLALLNVDTESERKIGQIKGVFQLDVDDNAKLQFICHILGLK